MLSHFARATRPGVWASSRRSHARDRALRRSRQFRFPCRTRAARLRAIGLEQRGGHGRRSDASSDPTRGRDIVSLLGALPGVASQTATDAPGANFGTTTPNINGNRATWNTMTVDGVVGNDLGSPQVFSSSINFDAIGEVQVQLNNYRAEYGRNGGPVVNIVTKSGTSQFKGSTYWYKRHEALNANDYFNEKNGVAKPLYRFDTV